MKARRTPLLRRGRSSLSARRTPLLRRGQSSLSFAGRTSKLDGDGARYFAYFFPTTVDK